MKKQDGFTLIEAIFIVIIVGIIGALGYLAYMNIIYANKAPDTSSTTAQPVKVESKKDLDTASTELDKVSVDDSDNTQFDSATNSF
jgi:Tfp pilus assembly protein PilE